MLLAFLLVTTFCSIFTSFLALLLFLGLSVTIVIGTASFLITIFIVVLIIFISVRILMLNSHVEIESKTFRDQFFVEVINDRLGSEDVLFVLSGLFVLWVSLKVTNCTLEDVEERLSVDSLHDSSGLTCLLMLLLLFDLLLGRILTFEPVDLTTLDLFDFFVTSIDEDSC